MQKRMWKVQEKARSNILKASDRQKRQYDVRVNQHRYQTGDVVWLHTLLRVSGWGPYIKSTGSSISLPSISMQGENLVVSCSDDR
jgi:hypothetical protein